MTDAEPLVPANGPIDPPYPSAWYHAHYLIDDPETGIVAMNAMAFDFLFIIGWLWADYTNMRRIRFGLALGSVAIALAAVAVMFD